ncbi:MAG TPA: BadF/BadG/BcrA/BcrD ATPase family protein [Terriglobales bacterium]|jgi:N-acetylglucosamine kinase-like BadF-type ATPase|nr:BadF/BadG/BcrA/BcrD ATPase family protein [Terriglobales bacterium]
MAFFLGIDGGGTKTSCLIGDEKSVLAEGTARASNVLRVGEAQAQTSLVIAIRQACHVAQIDPAHISRTCVGVAGAARPEVADIIRKILAKTVSGDIEIVGDMVIALHAAFGAGPGIVVIAGTGSVAYGRNAKGQRARAGGWGAAVSDEGSGNWIGRVAISAALRAADQSEDVSPLLQAITRVWNIEHRDAVVMVANASPAPDFAALFPAVLAATNGGDVLAASVLRRAGTELATLTKIVLGRLFSDADTVQVAMSGGVFANSALVREVFYNELRVQFPLVVMDEKMADPVQGALDLARSRTD